MSIKKEGFKKERLRSFFFNLEKKRKMEKKQEIIKEQLDKKGMEFIQMKLPIKNITKEFEDKIKAKVEHNILKAKIRRASEEDLDSIISIYNKAWLTSNEPFAPLSQNTLKILYNDPDIIILIAKVYGIDAGFIILDLEGPKKEYGVIAGLGVLPRFQRKGLGTVLGLYAWNYFKEKGIKELRCEVYPENLTSCNFINSLGFNQYDRKFYKSDDFILAS
ncbi:MAG: GNAT family N-acetyltransferase [Promethearchaeota archaeon]